MGRGDLARGALDRGEGAQVGGDDLEVGVRDRAADVVHGLRGLLGVAGGHDDGCAGPCQGAGGLQPEATVGAGDHRDLSVERGDVFGCPGHGFLRGE